MKYLGKTGQCRVDETEKGWFISVIQPDPAEAMAGEKRAKRERAEKARPLISLMSSRAVHGLCHLPGWGYRKGWGG